MIKIKENLTAMHIKCPSLNLSEYSIIMGKKN